MPEPNSTSAVLEPKEAEVTSGATPTPTETSQSPKEGVNSGEAPPAEGKPSQQTPSADDSDDKLPFNQHPRWKEVYGENKEMKKVVSELAELGVKSKEDLETLFKEAETTAEQARGNGHREIIDWIVSKPADFLVDLHKNHPDTYERVVESDVFSFAAAISSSNKELAEQIKAAAREFFGNGNGHRTPEVPGKTAASDETALETQKMELFVQTTADEVRSDLHSRLQDLTKGLEFRNSKQRENLFQKVEAAARVSLGKNRLFSQQADKLVDVRGVRPAELPGRRAELAGLHKRHLTDDLLKRLIGEEMEGVGVTVSQKAPSPNGERKEVIAGGAAPIGKGLTAESKEHIYNELVNKGLTGNQLAVEFSTALRKIRTGA